MGGNILLHLLQSAFSKELNVFIVSAFGGATFLSVMSHVDEGGFSFIAVMINKYHVKIIVE